MPLSECDEEFQLPADTLALLQGFYVERDAREHQFEDLKVKADGHFPIEDVSMEMFEEDWQASQFWYSDETAIILARELLRDATHETRIAVVSAPSVFVQMIKIIAHLEEDKRPQVHLLEYDERFAVFKEFVKYDLASPFRLPVELKASFDRIILDPPFLSSDCQTKVALTVRWLSRTATPNPEHLVKPVSLVRLIVSTGAVLEPLIHKLYAKEGIFTTAFLPQHSKGLSNEFRCWANFESEALGSRGS